MSNRFLYTDPFILNGRIVSKDESLISEAMCKIMVRDGNELWPRLLLILMHVTASGGD
jgi:hypothetical protein